MKIKNKLFKLLSTLLALNIFLPVGIVKADDYVVGDNGSGSSNEVAIESSSNSNVSQSNSADINNSVSVDADTGGNSAADNTGASSLITTGGVNTEVSIENSANASQVASTPCCNDGGHTLEILENGSGSNNTINIETENSDTVTITQTARITTRINGYANTGRNTVSGNAGGENTIRTGDVKVSERITNGPVNFVQVNLTSGDGNLITSIKENGTESENSINYSNSSFPRLVIDNTAYINNLTSWTLNTGKNTAGDNTDGDVKIETGDIDFYSIVNNIVNKSLIDLECCGEKEDEGVEKDEEEKDKEEDKDKNGDKPGEPNEDGKIPAKDAIKAGGPGILGLTDTSSGSLGNLIFIMGFAMAGTGSKIMYGEFSKVFKKKK